MSLYISEKDDEPKNKKDLLIARMHKFNNDKLDKNNYSYVYYSEDKKNGHSKLNIDDEHKFISLPIKQKGQIYSCYISGQSGSGKSTIASYLIEELMKQDKTIENIFYLTNQTVQDPAFKNLYKMKKKVLKEFKKNKFSKSQLIEIDEAIFITLDINNPDLYNLPISTFENSIMLFDDYEKLQNKDIEKKLETLCAMILNMGRKLNISPIIIRHKIQQSLKTAELLTEAQNIIVFPKYNLRDVKVFCEKYLQFSSEEISDIRNLETRSLLIRKTIPNFMISDYEIKLF